MKSLFKRTNKIVFALIMLAVAMFSVGMVSLNTKTTYAGDDGKAHITAASISVPNNPNLYMSLTGIDTAFSGGWSAWAQVSYTGSIKYNGIELKNISSLQNAEKTESAGVTSYMINYNGDVGFYITLNDGDANGKSAWANYDLNGYYLPTFEIAKDTEITGGAGKTLVFDKEFRCEYNGTTWAVREVSHVTAYSMAHDSNGVIYLSLTGADTSFGGGMSIWGQVTSYTGSFKFNGYEINTQKASIDPSITGWVFGWYESWYWRISLSTGDADAPGWAENWSSYPKNGYIYPTFEIAKGTGFNTATKQIIFDVDFAIENNGTKWRVVPERSVTTNAKIQLENRNLYISLPGADTNFSGGLATWAQVSYEGSILFNGYEVKNGLSALKKLNGDPVGASTYIFNYGANGFYITLNNNDASASYSDYANYQLNGYHKPTFEFKKNTIITGSAGKPIVIDKDYAFEFNSVKNAWEKVIDWDAVSTEVTVTGLTNESLSDGIYFILSDILPGFNGSWGVMGNMTVLIDGVETSVNPQDCGSNILYFAIPNVTKGTTVTFSKGSFLKNASKEQGLKITAEYSATFNGSAWEKVINYSYIDTKATSVLPYGGKTIAYLDLSAILSGVGADAGMGILNYYYNDVEKNEWAKYMGAGNAIYISGLNAVKGDVIEIKEGALMKRASTEEALRFTEGFKMTFNGTAWEKVVEYQDVDTKVTSVAGDIGGSTIVYFNIENAIEGIGAEGVIGNIDILINGVSATKELHRSGWDDKVVYINGLSMSANDTLEIASGTLVKNVSKEQQLKFTEGFKMTFNGSKWEKVVDWDSVSTDVTVTALTNESIADTFYFLLSDVIPGVGEWSSMGTLTVKINGVETNVGVNFASGKIVYFGVSGATKGTTITIEEGSFLKNPGKSLALKFTEKFEVEFNGSEWEKTSVEYDYLIGKVTGVGSENSSANTVFLTLSNVIPGIGNDGKMGYLTFYYNDVEQNKPVNKAWDNVIYIPGFSAVKGDRIEIKAGATLRSPSKAQAVMINEDFTLEFNGTTWEEIVDFNTVNVIVTGAVEPSGASIIYLGVDNDFTGFGPDASIANITVKLDGVDTVVELHYGWKNVLYISGLTAEAGTTLRIPAGLVLKFPKDKVAYKFTDGYFFEFEEGAWVNTEYYVLTIHDFYVGDTVKRIKPNSDYVLPTHIAGNIVLGYTCEGVDYLPGDIININKDTSVEAKDVSFAINNGAYMRTTGVSGLKFTANLDYDALDSANLQDLVIGFMVIPTEYLKDKEFIYTAFDAGTADGFVDIIVTGNGRKGAITTVSAVMTDLNESLYNKAFSARAYLKFTYKSQTVYLYSEYVEANNSRSLYQVALGGLSDPSITGLDTIALFDSYCDNIIDITEVEGVYSVTENAFSAKAKYNVSGKKVGLYNKITITQDEDFINGGTGFILNGVRYTKFDGCVKNDLVYDIEVGAIADNYADKSAMETMAFRTPGDSINTFAKSYLDEYVAVGFDMFSGDAEAPYAGAGYYTAKHYSSLDSAKSNEEVKFFNYGGTNNHTKEALINANLDGAKFYVYDIRLVNLARLTKALINSNDSKEILYIVVKANVAAGDPGYDAGYMAIFDLDGGSFNAGNTVFTDKQGVARDVLEVVYQFDSQADLNETVDVWTSAYRKQAGFGGCTVWDEPNAAMFPALGAIHKALVSVGIDVRTCLYPIYGLGNSETNWTNYINGYLDATDATDFEFDSYNLNNSGITGSYLRQLQLASSIASDRNVTFSQAVQAFKEDSLRSVTKADLYWQTMLALGFGADRVSYYSYEAIGAATQTIKGNLYTEMCEVVPAMEALSKVVRCFDYKASMTKVKSGSAVVGATGLVADSFTGNFKSAMVNAGAVLINEMYDEATGLYGYFVINGTNPSASTTSKVMIGFNNASSILAYSISGGECVANTYTSATHTFELAAGQGVFVIAY